MAGPRGNEESSDPYFRIWGAPRPAGTAVEPHKDALPLLSPRKPDDAPEPAAPKAPTLVEDPLVSPEHLWKAIPSGPDEEPASGRSERNGWHGPLAATRGDDPLAQIRPVLVSLLARMTAMEISLADLITRVDGVAQALNTPSNGASRRRGASGRPPE
ncbi:MAG: hypothetical protein ACRDJU_07030 [Actinomycetota bacterium]